LDKLPALRSLRDPRHPGITDALCEAMTEAAEVALARHHAPPATDFAVSCGGMDRKRQLGWKPPTEAMLRAWNNRDDTTRDGAYIVAIAAVEAEMGLVALMRAETRTGADYYVGHVGASDLEQALRLEVSGVDSGDLPTIRRRLTQKIEQTREGESNLPAISGVVGFREAVVLVSDVEAA
jgi:hypothetical protein